MATFLTYAHPVSASLLDTASGDELVPVQPGAEHSRSRGVLETTQGAREAVRTAHHRPRTMTIAPTLLTKPEHDALASALLAAKGGAGAVEARHPDDASATATLWRFAEGVEFSRTQSHLTATTVVLEEL